MLISTKFKIKESIDCNARNVINGKISSVGHTADDMKTRFTNQKVT